MNLRGKALRTTPVDVLAFQDAVGQELIPNPHPEDEWLDGFTALYERDIEMQACDPTDEPWKQAVQNALESETLQSVRQSTVFDSVVSAVGTNTIVPELQRAAAEYRERMQQAQESGDPRAELRAQAVLHQHVLKAVHQTKENVEQAVQVLALAKEAGQEPAQFLQFTFTLNERVREMVLATARWFGRLQAEWQAIASERVRRAVTPKGVTLGDDLLRLLPHELATLRYAPLLFKRKMVERQLMEYDVETAHTKTEKGDVVLLLDESGSMTGEPISVAKAYAWFLREKMAQEGRYCHIISFSTSTIHLSPQAPQEDVQRWLASFMSGGTDFNRPLLEAVQVIEEHQLRKPDILVVTDGYAELAEHVAEGIRQCKQRHGARLFVLHVENSQSVLSEIADVQAKISLHTLELVM